MRMGWRWGKNALYKWLTVYPFVAVVLPSDSMARRAWGSSSGSGAEYNCGGGGLCSSRAPSLDEGMRDDGLMPRSASCSSAGI